MVVFQNNFATQWKRNDGCQKEYKFNTYRLCSLADRFEVQILVEEEYAQLQMNTYYTYLQHYGMFFQRAMHAGEVFSNMLRKKATAEVYAEAMGTVPLNPNKQLFAVMTRYLAHSNTL